MTSRALLELLRVQVCAAFLVILLVTLLILRSPSLSGVQLQNPNDQLHQ